MLGLKLNHVSRIKLTESQRTWKYMPWCKHLQNVAVIILILMFNIQIHFDVYETQC